MLMDEPRAPICSGRPRPDTATAALDRLADRPVLIEGDAPGAVRAAQRRREPPTARPGAAAPRPGTRSEGAAPATGSGPAERNRRMPPVPEPHLSIALHEEFDPRERRHVRHLPVRPAARRPGAADPDPRARTWALDCPTTSSPGTQQLRRQLDQRPQNPPCPAPGTGTAGEHK